MIRRFLENLGLIDPRPVEQAAVHKQAWDNIHEAEQELRASRARREVLRLRLEQLERRRSTH